MKSFSVATEPSPESLQYRGFRLHLHKGLDILQFEQTLLFYSTSYFNFRGLELCLGEDKPSKPP